MNLAHTYTCSKYYWIYRLGTVRFRNQSTKYGVIVSTVARHLGQKVRLTALSKVMGPLVVHITSHYAEYWQLPEDLASSSDGINPLGRRWPSVNVNSLSACAWLMKFMKFGILPLHSSLCAVVAPTI